MKYKNASEVLPAALLKEVQKYAAGETLYFPKTRSRQKWGEASGALQFYRERNREIRRQYKAHSSLERIAEEFHLSPDTVRKIVFARTDWED